MTRFTVLCLLIAALLTFSVEALPTRRFALKANKKSSFRKFVRRDSLEAASPLAKFVRALRSRKIGSAVTQLPSGETVYDDGAIPAQVCFVSITRLQT